MFCARRVSVEREKGRTIQRNTWETTSGETLLDLSVERNVEMRFGVVAVREMRCKVQSGIVADVEYVRSE
jgi:hypothetical protein